MLQKMKDMLRMRELVDEVAQELGKQRSEILALKNEINGLRGGFLDVKKELGEANLPQDLQILTYPWPGFSALGCSSFARSHAIRGP